MATCEIQSSRAEPAAWAPLLEVAETAVPAASHEEWGDSPGMRSLYDGLQKLSMEDLSNVTFYGHGLVICEIAKSLRNPSVRNQIVAIGADTLIYASEQMGGGVSALAVDPDYLEDGYAGLVREAYDRRPAAERLVGEMSLSQRFERRDTTENGSRPKLWTPKSLREERYAVLSQGVVSRMNREVTVNTRGMVHPQGVGLLIMEAEARSPRMESMIRRNIVLSATYLAALVLDGLNPQIKEGELPSPEDIAVLRHRSTKQAALQACRVSSDEFFDRANPIMRVLDGQAVFRDPLKGGKRPKPSRRRHVFKYGLRGRQYYERDDPLICPAADVSGMVPLSLDLVGRIVETATKWLAQNDVLGDLS